MRGGVGTGVHNNPQPGPTVTPEAKQQATVLPLSICDRIFCEKLLDRGSRVLRRAGEQGFCLPAILPALPTCNAVAGLALSLSPIQKTWELDALGLSWWPRTGPLDDFFPVWYRRLLVPLCLFGEHRRRDRGMVFGDRALGMDLLAEHGADPSDDIGASENTM
jgi:hypothetical protein